MPAITVNGIKLNYEEVGSGDPLIYIAGTRYDSAHAWMEYMGEHAAGFRVILPDPRGMGGSQRVPDMEPKEWVSDLAGVLDALELERAHLCGETFGTRLITRFAADHPKRVSTLILNSVIAYSYAEGDAARRESADVGNIPPDRAESLQFHHGEGWAEVNAFYLRMHGKPEFHEFFDLRKAAGRIQAPTLIIRGDVDDRPHPVAHSVELHALIPNSWLVIYPNTEFNAFRAHPKEVWDLIRSFTKNPTASFARGPRPGPGRPG